MTSHTKLLIIVVTWGGLLILYGINRFLLKDQLLTNALVVSPTARSQYAKPPGSLMSKVGVLFVFIINIVTLFLLVIDWLSPSVIQSRDFLQVNMPIWVNVFGSFLFVIGTFWGFFAMIYNPTYTPLYKFPPEKFILAMQGPYRTTRHPRYASEALLNISLFLLTGIWLPLLGLFGWVAMFYQAKAEEEYLMSAAPNEYSKYRERTCMFFPVPSRNRKTEKKQ